ncbi:hypothetical protein RND81_05G128000 [Saponaria officinalis]
MASVPMTILTGGTAQAAGTLVGPVTDAGKGIYSSLKHKLDYIQNFDRNFKILEDEKQYLISRKNDVDDLIAKNQVLKEKTHECATWLEDVEKVTIDLSSMKLKYEETSRMSPGLSQLRRRLKLSKQIVKMTKTVTDLRDKMNYEHMLVTERRPLRLEKFPINISQVPSLEENVEKLIELLNDDTIKKIGIWGMPGVGKTTILENLNERVAKLGMFDMVLWVTMSNEHCLDHIQQSIMKQLTSNVEVFNDPGKAAVFISETLKNKKYLLLLDGVSSKIELRHVGIHDGHIHGKVVLATRERTLCYVMEMDDDIKIERMSRDDARKLFREVVGHVANHPCIVTIAERIVIQCGEQPQVIKAVGSYLNGKLDENLWLSTLSKLQSPQMYQLKHLEDMFTAFELIFDELHTGLQECFLYGASFPEDYEIYRDYLVECWRTEQLIGINQSLRKAYEEGHASLEDLIDKCLFDDRCCNINYVKMPIIFRNAAIKMAQLQNFGLLVKDEEELEEHPSLVAWTNGRIISLINSNLIELPQRPKCPKISTLFLQKNKMLSTIPASFFEEMSTLKTLDLYGTSIKELPPSISKLTNLRGMYLNDCQYLINLPNELGELQSLQLLDICRSGISGFPLVIGELTGLQCLRLSFTSVSGNQNSESEPVILNIFERLVRLEELVIIADPKDPKWKKIAPGIAAKLAGLKKLSALTFYFPDTESLEAFIQASVSWQNGTSPTRSNFRSFNIYVGSKRNDKSSCLDVSKCPGRRYLQCSGMKDVPCVIKEVLKRACAFELINHHDITNFSDLGIDGMECLEICVVEGCSAIEKIIDNLGVSSALPWLKELHLLKLHQLKHICRGPISPNSFAKLTKLTLYECMKLSQAISWEMAKELNELQHLSVQKCSQVTEVFEICAPSIDTPLCPKLKMLELVNLEELIRIHNGTFEWLGLQKIEVTGCDKLDNLCLDGMNARKLQQITCKETWWDTLTMSVEIKAHLLPFCRFV